MGKSLGMVLLLRYCVTRFACRILTWKLPVGGGVAGLLAEYGSGGHPMCVLLVLVLGLLGGDIRELDSAEKNPCVRFFGVGWRDQPRLRVWKRLRIGSSLKVEDDDAGGRHLHDHQDRVRIWLKAIGAARTLASKSAWV